MRIANRRAAGLGLALAAGLGLVAVPVGSALASTESVDAVQGSLSCPAGSHVVVNVELNGVANIKFNQLIGGSYRTVAGVSGQSGASHDYGEGYVEWEVYSNDIAYAWDRCV